MDSTFNEAHWFRGWAYEQNGRYEEAIAAYQQSTLLREKHEQLAWLGHAYGISGNKAEALKLIDEFNDEFAAQIYLTLLARYYSSRFELQR